ncbi:amidohydrolase family protein [Henriciella sp.]|uniref:amidohydrolase family protein n=1 Tax=Henriciella sp. TaxID=1968823 RepID=UPI00261D1753|nr:amidohydrolase family protein [Henriciella sp.]
MRRAGGRGTSALLTLMLAACTGQPAPGPVETGDLLIQNARLVDLSGETASIRERASLLVRAGDIVAIGESTARFDAPEVLDAEGRTVTPGLADMHVHVWDEAELGAYLSYGVTTIRNLSGMPFHLSLQREVETGERPGPRLLTSGPILNSAGPNAQVNHKIVEEAEAARAAIDWQAEAGFTRIKVYSNLRREAYEAILAAAAEHGMRVTGHTPEGLRRSGVPLTQPFAIAFEDVLDDGFETIEHVESIVWHGLRDRHDEDAARELGRRIAAVGVPVTPTRVAHHNLLRMAESDGARAQREEMALLNPFVQGMEQGVIAFWASQPSAPLAANDAFQARVTKIFQEEGVVLVAGSDAGIFINVPGLSLIDELTLLVEAGLTPYEALQAATWNAALAVGEVDEHGCMAEGCAADLVIYACDPLIDISCAGDLTGVVRAGQWLPEERLLALRAAAVDEQDIARTQANLFAGLEAQGTPLPGLPDD